MVVLLLKAYIFLTLIFEIVLSFLPRGMIVLNQNQNTHREFSYNNNKGNSNDKKTRSILKVDRGTNFLGTNPFGQALLVTAAREGWRFAWERLVTELAPQSKDGEYGRWTPDTTCIKIYVPQLINRPSYSFTGELGSEEFPLEKGRYHLYVGNPCPWCHRVSLAHAIYQLSDTISLSYAIDDPIKARRGGWAFASNTGTASSSATGGGVKKMYQIDPIFNAPDLLEVYNLCSPTGSFTGRCTAPVLVDTVQRKIVSNESKDIVRMFRKMSSVDLCPPSVRESIETMNNRVYKMINNGVYRAGFSTQQAPYDAAVKDVFTGLTEINQILSNSKFLHGRYVTEPDVFLLPTIVRFDAIYHSLFKCSQSLVCSAHIEEFKHVQRWLYDMYTIPNVRNCFDLRYAKRSYFQQLFPLNPSRIIPVTTEQYYQDLLTGTVEDATFADKCLLKQYETSALPAAGGVLE